MTKHICIGYCLSFSIIMKARRVKFEKCVAKWIFSRLTTQRFDLPQSHVAVNLIRSCHGLPTTVGGLRTHQIAMVGESEPPFACHNSVVRS